MILAISPLFLAFILLISVKSTEQKGKNSTVHHNATKKHHAVTVRHNSTGHLNATAGAVGKRVSAEHHISTGRHNKTGEQLNVTGAAQGRNAAAIEKRDASAYLEEWSSHQDRGGKCYKVYNL